MKMMKMMIEGIFLGWLLTTQVQADDRLVGSWVKHHTQQEDHAYPGDTNWNLEVTFQAGGQFAWNSTRVEGSNTINESVTGMYTVSHGMITVNFDKPSTAARKRLSEWFAFWPARMKGQQTFRFEKEFLVLGHDGEKLWFHMKKKTAEPSSPGDAEASAPEK